GSKAPPVTPAVPSPRNHNRPWRSFLILWKLAVSSPSWTPNCFHRSPSHRYAPLNWLPLETQMPPISSSHNPVTTFIYSPPIRLITLTTFPLGLRTSIPPAVPSQIRPSFARRISRIELFELGKGCF